MEEKIAEKDLSKDLQKLYYPPSKEPKFESFEEGLSAQIKHIGPYSAERATIERLHKFIRDSGHKVRGKHHEIHVGNPRRSKPEKLKTVLRRPFK